MGWLAAYRIEPFVHAPTLLRRVQEVLPAHGVTATVGSPHLFTEEQRIVLPLYGDVSTTVCASVEQALTIVVGGLVTLHIEAQAPDAMKRIEQNEAMRTAKSLLPESLHATKVGVDPAAGILRITVCFPDAVIGAPEAKACEDQIARDTGWRAAWGTTTNQAQLAIVVQMCIEKAGGRVMAQPSLHLDHKTAEVRTDIAGQAWERAAAAFRQETGWTLIRHTAVESGGQARPVQPGAMKMHDALTWIEREAAGEGITLYRKFWYGDRVELGFVCDPRIRTDLCEMAGCLLGTDRCAGASGAHQPTSTHVTGRSVAARGRRAHGRPAQCVFGGSDRGGAHNGRHSPGGAGSLSRTDGRMDATGSTGEVIRTYVCFSPTRALYFRCRNIRSGGRHDQSHHAHPTLPPDRYP